MLHVSGGKQIQSWLHTAYRDPIIWMGSLIVLEWLDRCAWKSGNLDIIFMDDNAIPHRSRAVLECLRQNATETHSWPASTDLNPKEHLWDILGHQFDRDPTVKNYVNLLLLCICNGLEYPRPIHENKGGAVLITRCIYRITTLEFPSLIL